MTDLKKTGNPLTPRLFSPASGPEWIAPQAALLHGFAIPQLALMREALQFVLVQAPLRHMSTPNGHRMSVAMSNCGRWGWVSDQHGYRYTAADPLNDQPWPDMPPVFCHLAQHAAATTGFSGFTPDCCLINRYAVGTRLSLHQDKDEQNLSAPIVSVSLLGSAVFLWGGSTRTAPVQRLWLYAGDTLVWGGVDRLRYHGVQRITAEQHAGLGECRINLTFRQAKA